MKKKVVLIVKLEGKLEWVNETLNRIEAKEARTAKETMIISSMEYED